MIGRTIRAFIGLESVGGILLIAALILVLIVANSPLYPLYEHIINIPFQIKVGYIDLHKSLQLWMNEGLMVLFFMLLSLELKREALQGELSSVKEILLPLIASIGGVIVPIVIYFVIVGGNVNHAAGWAIPTSTDVALVLGLLSLLGKRIPRTLILFFLAIAIVDDIIAVVLIAVFYSQKIAFVPMLVAFFGVVTLFSINVLGVKKITPYILIGVIIWVAVIKSGIHATLAGVFVGFCVPLRNRQNPQHSPLKILEHNLHPWVTFLIAPLFVLLNAGVPFSFSEIAEFFHPITIAVALGLFVGKQVGIMLFVILAVKCRVSTLPSQVNWWQMYGISVLCGIGFTMSLFVASLAFTDNNLIIISRQGILFGSFLSTIIGMLVLYISRIKNYNDKDKDNSFL